LQVDCASNGGDPLAKLSLARLWQALHDDSRLDLDVKWNGLLAEDKLARFSQEGILLILVRREVESLAIQHCELFRLLWGERRDWAITSEFRVLIGV